MLICLLVIAACTAPWYRFFYAYLKINEKYFSLFLVSYCIIQ